MNNFVDIAKIKILAGNGGDGIVSFRREKYIAKGGPDGGDGGKGGDVYFQADGNLSTLMDFRSKEIYKAKSGEKGGKKKMTGSGGKDLFVRMPVGTLIFEIDQAGEERLIADMIKSGQIVLIARGGKGGKGNFRFKSSTNRTPMQFVRGGTGEAKNVRLEMKLIADVGITGLPNAGKSTLINQLANSNAKIDKYPFTTLRPNLGVCKLNDENSVILADIPGLIEGASKGRGLGDDFLRHVERTRVLVHLIDPMFLSTEEVFKAYLVIRNELKAYSEKLDEKKEIVVINKLDVTEVKEGFLEIKRLFAKKGIKVLGISAVTGEGIDVLKREILKVLENEPKEVVFEQKSVRVYTIDTLPNKRMVFTGR